jgi:tyrosine-protein kinase Etk/Wzc
MLRATDAQLRSFMQAPPVEDGSFADRLAILWDYRWRVLLIALVFTLMGTAYAFVAPPTYRADFAVQIEQPSPVSSGAQTLLGENLSGFLGISSQSTTEIELLRSRLVLGQTVDDLHLYVDAEPRRFPILGRIAEKLSSKGQPSKPWLGIGRFAWGGEAISVSRLDVPETLYDEKWRLVAGDRGSYTLFFDGTPILAGNVGVLEKASMPEGDVTIKVDELISYADTQFTLVRHERLDTIDKLSTKLLVEERSKDSGVVGVTLDGKSAEGITAVLNHMGDVYLQQNADRKAAEAENMISFLEKQLPSIRAQMETAERAYNDFRKQHAVVDIGEESKLLLKQVVDSQTQLADLEQKRSALLQHFTGESPDVTMIEAQIAQLNVSIGTLNTKIKRLPDNEQIAVGLMRDVQVDTQLYTNLLNNLEQLRIVKAGKIGSVRIVDHAVKPYFPVRPKKILVIPLSLVLGLILGSLAVIVHHGLVNGVEDPDLVESQLGLAVYATIPHSPKQATYAQYLNKGKTPRFLAGESSGDVAIESIRSLTTTLHFATMDAYNNVMVIAGPAPGVGKSFVALNMSAVWAGMGKRVLLIDGDLRRGYLHQYLGVDRADGLSDAISGRKSIDEVIRKEVAPGLDFISTGLIPPNPAELLLHSSFERVLRELQSRYEMVVIDTPPVLAVTDAAIIGRLAGAALLVLKFGAHPLSEIETTAKRLQQAGVELKGVIFNDLPVRNSRYRYGRHRYSYQYSYEEKSKVTAR